MDPHALGSHRIVSGFFDEEKLLNHNPERDLYKYIVSVWFAGALRWGTTFPGAPIDAGARPKHKATVIAQRNFLAGGRAKYTYTVSIFNSILGISWFFPVVEFWQTITYISKFIC